MIPLVGRTSHHNWEVDLDVEWFGRQYKSPDFMDLFDFAERGSIRTIGFQQDGIVDLPFLVLFYASMGIRRVTC